MQFTERQAQALKRIAARRRVSLSKVVREAVDTVIDESQAGTSAEARRRALAAIGRFTDAATDVSERHDDYLALAALE